MGKLPGTLIMSQVKSGKQLKVFMKIWGFSGVQPVFMDAPLKELMNLIVSMASAAATVPGKHLPAEWITAGLATKCVWKDNANNFKRKLNLRRFLKSIQFDSVVMSASPLKKLFHSVEDED